MRGHDLELLLSARGDIGETLVQWLTAQPAGPEQMFEHLYARLPKQLIGQLSQLTEEQEGHVEHHAG